MAGGPSMQELLLKKPRQEADGRRLKSGGRAPTCPGQDVSHYRGFTLLWSMKGSHWDACEMLSHGKWVLMGEGGLGG